MPKEKTIPDKMYFRIGEAAELLSVKPYVLRYWETEFPDIKPVKSQSNQRLYKRRDVELLMAVRHLLYDEKFTINGARQHLKELLRSDKSGQSDMFTAGVPKAKEKEKGKAQAPAQDSSKKVFLKIREGLELCLADLRK